MSTVVQKMMAALCAIIRGLPMGTNLALLHFLWMLVTGSLLPSRGALFPALQSIGLSAAAVRRAWAAFRYGAWDIETLLQAWQQYVEQDGQWQAHHYDGYRPKAVDITAFWRPTLKGCPSKHYHHEAGKALPAIIMGVVAQSGSIAGHRLALSDAFIRVDPDAPDETSLKTKILQQVAETLASDEVAVIDAGLKVRDCQEAGLERWEIRLAKNFTARRNTPAPSKGKGPQPVYGELIRPLARTYNGRTIPATPPDRVEIFVDEEGCFIRVALWQNLVRPDVKADPGNETFTVAAIYDPRYKNPLLVAFSLDLSVEAVHGMYRDRWPVEQIPLAAKHMLGAHRQFVFAPESCQRLPELTLLAGNILTYMAATLPAIPTGFWDRKPERTPGRLRRALAGVAFSESYPLPKQIRKKASVTRHLPKGVLGHRRRAAA